MNNVVNLCNKDFNTKINNDKSAVVIDVRTPQEFNAGHIPNSILIDIYNPSFPNKILKLDKSKNYYIYCRSGHRSYYAGVFMLSNGFKEVHHLEKGILDWSDSLES